MGLARKLQELLRLPVRDGQFFEQLEDVLLEGDIGPAAAAEILGALREQVRSRGWQDRLSIAAALRERLRGYLRSQALLPQNQTLSFFLVLGVNGVGKTTTIAKLAHYYHKRYQRKVLLAAGDTFRAAAIDQLVLWARRLELPVVRQDPGADPGSVLHDAITSAQSRGLDLVLADTAGRMHTKAHLVKELGKIDKIVRARIPAGAYRKVLVIDATTGQNALRQAEVFHEALGVDSVVLAKYDSTAKGGIVISICRDLGLPFSFLGTGQQLEDLLPFEPERFLDNLIVLQ